MGGILLWADTRRYRTRYAEWYGAGRWRVDLSRAGQPVGTGWIDVTRGAEARLEIAVTESPEKDSGGEAHQAGASQEDEP